MSRITRNGAAPQVARPAAPAPAAPVARHTTPAVGGLRPLLDRAIALQQRLKQATEAGQWPAARKLQGEMRQVVGAMQALPGNNPARAQAIAAVGAAVQTVERQLASAPRPAPRPASPPQPAANGGPLGFLGRAAKAAGTGLDKVGKVAFFPLNALGKVLDPVRAKIGGGLSSVKSAIDNSVVGKAPVVGPAVRFTTGLASSLVGMVDGAVQAVTHPAELVKGVASIAGTVVGLVPGPRQAWDYAVHGKDPVTSYKEALGEAKALGTALIQPSLDDFKAGNYAGGIGRLVGDVGSLLVTGGAAGGVKGAQAGMVASRLGKLGRAGKVLKAGARAIGAVDDLSAKIIGAGLKANFAPVAKAGQALGGAAPLRKLAGLADEAAQANKPQAAVAAVATKPKAAYAFADDLLRGEVKLANAPGLDEAIAAQQGVIGRLGGTPVWEHLSDTIRGAMVDTEHKLIAAVKDLKLNGKAVTSLEDAVEAWKALPENAPQRAIVARQLAGAMQESFAEGLKFPPAAVEFTPLADNLAGLNTEAKVLLDPSLLNEDLRYLVDVMAEEQTHAYQRFLTDNRAAITVDPKMAAEIEKYAKEFQVEHYLNPPAAGLEVLASGVKGLDKPLRDLADHADENLVLMLRREAAPLISKGTPERAVLDAWWSKAGPESEKLSFMKFALGDLNKASKSPTAFKTWLGDYGGRLPEGITHVDGVARSLEDAQSALNKAIKESQGTLSQAHREVSQTFADWTAAYKSQSLEFTAKHVASDVARWMFGS